MQEKNCIGLSILFSTMQYDNYKYGSVGEWGVRSVVASGITRWPSDLLSSHRSLTSSDNSSQAGVTETKPSAADGQKHSTSIHPTVLASHVASITAENQFSLLIVKEEKAKAISAVSGTEFIQFLVALANLH